jgi:hypothetical protein
MLISLNETFFTNPALVVIRLGRVALAGVLFVRIETTTDLTMEGMRL